MLNRQFIADMFRPGGQLSPPSSMKALLEKVVHASIMRLGQESLDKLFDLMFMAVKFQLFSAPVPSQLLFITLVHVESWTLMTQDPEIIFLIQNVQNLLINVSLVSYVSLDPVNQYQLVHDDGRTSRICPLGHG